MVAGTSYPPWPSNGDSNVQFTLKITFKAENVIFNVLETFPSHFFGFFGDDIACVPASPWFLNVRVFSHEFLH